MSSDDHSRLLETLWLRREVLAQELLELDTTIKVLSGLDGAHQAPTVREAHASDAPAVDPPKPQRKRTAAKHHYAIDLPADADIDALPQAPQQREVLKAIRDAGPEGAVAKDIIDRTGLPSGSLQWILRLLRDEGQIHVVEPKSDTP